jgi:hypothetical protein
MKPLRWRAHTEKDRYVITVDVVAKDFHLFNRVAVVLKEATYLTPMPELMYTIVRTVEDDINAALNRIKGTRYENYLDGRDRPNTRPLHNFPRDQRLP